MSRRKKSIVLLLIMIISLSFTLSGCHGQKKEMAAFNVPEEFDESREYEISFWAKNDTNRTQTEIYAKAIENFEALYPNISVNLRLYTKYGDIYNDVITNISTNTTPNVCISYPDHIATYLTGSNVVVPLDSLYSDPEYGLGGERVKFDSVKQEEIVPKFLQEGIYQGIAYAMPFMRSTEVCYINKDMLEKLGYELPEKLTWDFVWEVSEKAMEKDASGSFKVNGQNVLIPFIYKSTDNMMINMLRQLDAGYSNPQGDILIFNDTTREILNTIAEHGKSRAFSTFKISSYPGNFMNAGQCIFAIDSTAGATWMGSNAPLIDISEEKLVEFETAVKPIPQFDTENPHMISQGPSICIFNKQDPQEVLASWLFAQYLLTNDVQTAYAETEGYIPVTLKAQSSKEYQDYLSRAGEDNKKYYDIKIEASKLLLDNIENTFVTPVFNGSASLRDAAGQLIENTVKSVRRKETVDDKYFDKLFSDVKSLYRLDQSSAVDSGKADLGPLPDTAVILLSSIAAAWVLIIIYWLIELKKRKNVKT